MQKAYWALDQERQELHSQAVLQLQLLRLQHLPNRCFIRFAIVEIVGFLIKR
jgi:hypothetical protein